MTLSEWWQQVLVAIAGGAAAELLHWYVLARAGRPVRKYATRPLYWLTTLGMILIGGVMPLLYLSGSGGALLCFHPGAATPLLLAKLVSQAPQGVQPQGPADPDEPRLRDFLGW